LEDKHFIIIDTQFYSHVLWMTALTSCHTLL